MMRTFTGQTITTFDQLANINKVRLDASEQEEQSWVFAKDFNPKNSKDSLSQE
jgi:hypothetical protein